MPASIVLQPPWKFTMEAGGTPGLHLRRDMIALLRFLLRLCFRFRAFNEGVLKQPGPVLLLPNHVSWFDWLLLGVCLDDDWRFVTSSDDGADELGAPADHGQPPHVSRGAQLALRRQAHGGVSAEGRPPGAVSRRPNLQTGSLMKLFDGTGFLIYKTRAKVITAYLRAPIACRSRRNPDGKAMVPRVSAPISARCSKPPSTRANEHHRGARSHHRLAAGPDGAPAVRGGNGVRPAAPCRRPSCESARQRPRAVVLQDVTLQRLTYRRPAAGREPARDAVACA